MRKLNQELETLKGVINHHPSGAMDYLETIIKRREEHQEKVNARLIGIKADLKKLYGLKKQFIKELKRESIKKVEK